MRRDRLLRFSAALVAAGAAYVVAIRPWHLRWGATNAEVEAALPGDDLTPEPVKQVTHAITIQASASAVWPWLAQIGQTKGGCYSYTWLENLVGCQMHNADRIVPEWQSVQVGDEVWLHPKAPPLPVVLVEPERALVLGSNTANLGTWGFYLKAVNENTTRLIIRSRSQAWKPAVFGWLGYHMVFEPAHFIMEQKMLRNIKRLAEEAYSALPTAAHQAKA
jgi:hypothetical protein